MSDVMYCPTCGGEIKGKKEEMRSLMGMRLSVMQKSILRELIAAWPGALRNEELVWRIYRGEEPEDAAATIRIFIHRLREALKGKGWRVVNLNGPGGGAGNPAEYVLKKIEGE